MEKKAITDSSGAKAIIKASRVKGIFTVEFPFIETSSLVLFPFFNF
jgi:hypothetical protein